MIQKNSRVLLFLLFALVAPVRESIAATFEIYPSTVGDCNEEIENIANAIKPGDELIMHGGEYSQTCRRGIMLNGTATQPIVIRSADGETPVLTRPSDNIDTQNNLEVANSSYLVLKGLELKGGSVGIRFIGGHHITLEESDIYETGSNGIT